MNDKEIEEIFNKYRSEPVGHGSVKDIYFAGFKSCQSIMQQILDDLKEQLSGTEAARLTYKRGAITTHTENIEKINQLTTFVSKMRELGQALPPNAISVEIQKAFREME